MFKTVNKDHIDRMSMKAVVHGMPFEWLMIKLRHTDTIWRDGI